MDPSRREFLKSGLFGVGIVSLALVAYDRYGRTPAHAALPELMGPLQTTADENTGLPLLRLPEGFRYRTFSWTGSTMSDGRPVPGRIDGMGVVKQEDSRVTLVRNHELTGSTGVIGAVGDSYDNTGGGTTTLIYDIRDESLVASWVSLSGTLGNCAGGVTPWGSWLSCEEAVFSPALADLPVPDRQLFWNVENAQREHGFVFEVPAKGVARPEPILAMGQMYHEAAAVDPDSGMVYLTEDLSPKCGFYRYIPDKPGNLVAGGLLQMMAVQQARDMRDGLALFEKLDVAWVDIAEPEKGNTRGSRSGNGVVTQGLEAGGSAFVALEGCEVHGGNVYFTSKLGGSENAGYIFEYDPRQEQIWLVHESPGHDLISGPDNIIMSPRGSLVVCEDRVNRNKVGQSLNGLTREGVMFRFCQINPILEGQFGGHDLQDTARNSEWAGVTFSRDGEWLFCNVYNPGMTIAITGPWREGLI